MKHLFLPYELSLEIKNIGFDEPCFAHYINKEFIQSYASKNNSIYDCIVPTFQQAIDWFREKHCIHTHVISEFYKDGINYNWQVVVYDANSKGCYDNEKSTGWFGDNGEFPTYYSALTEAIKESINIVKNQKK